MRSSGTGAIVIAVIAGVLLAGAPLGALSARAAQDGWKARVMIPPPSPSLRVHDPAMLLDGPRARDMLKLRIQPRPLDATTSRRWDGRFQQTLERLDDEDNMYWVDLANYRISLARYLVKRRCGTASHVRLRAMWTEMVARHDMLLATVGEDAVQVAVARAAADADVAPCG